MSDLLKTPWGDWTMAMVYTVAVYVKHLLETCCLIFQRHAAAPSTVIGIIDKDV